MKHFVKAAFLSVGLSIAAFAEQVPTPTMSGDSPLMDYVGVSTYRVSTTTGGIVSTYPTIVYGVSTSSIAATAYMNFFSTNSVALAGAIPTKVQYNDDSGADEDVTATKEYNWVRPIKFPKGLVVQLQAAPGATQWSEWVIYYREVR
jgi:hypothetical protein